MPGVSEANMLKDKFQVNCPEKIAERMNIRVVEHGLPDSKSFSYRDEKTGRVYILVPENITSWRRRYLIAHELAHIIMHPGQINHEYTVNSRFVTSYLDREAELFARELLSPTEKPALRRAKLSYTV